METKTKWGILSVMAMLGLSACRNHTTLVSTGSIANGFRDDTKTYPVVVKSIYHDQIMKDSQGLIINSLSAPVNQTYYFNFDSSAVRFSDLQAIHIQANYLASHLTSKVRLEGNTDSRGSREYNIGLGWRRCQTIFHILEQEGVAPSQLDIVSYGKERPAVLGNNECVWRLNRRVNLVYETY